MAFPDAAGGINEATSQAHEAQQQTQTNGHNTVASPSRESSEVGTKMHIFSKQYNC